MSDVLLGVLIGAGATLAGTGVQLWFGARRGERERYMQLRRDVYLSAAEGLAACVEYLNQHSRADVPFGKAVAPSGMVSWLFKTYLIAETDALIAFNEASASIAAALIDLVPYRLAVQQADDEIAIARTGIESTERYVDEMRSEIKNVDVTQLTEAGVRHAEWAAAQHEAETKMLEEQLRHLEALSYEHSLRVKTLVEKAIGINRVAQQPIRNALLAARSELDVRIDKNKFASAIEAWDAAGAAKISKLITLIDQQNPPTGAATTTATADHRTGEKRAPAQ